MRRKITYSKEEKTKLLNLIKKLHSQGLTYREISEKIGVNPSTIALWIRNSGIKTKTTIDKEYVTIKVKELYPKGYSRKDLSKLLNVSTYMIKNIMNENNMAARDSGKAGKLKSKKYDYNENYFSNIDTVCKAFVVGIIFSIGHIYDFGKRKRLLILFQMEHIDIFEKIANDLKVPIKKSSFGNENWSEILINSTKICNDLEKLGFYKKEIQLTDEELLKSYKEGFDLISKTR